MGVRASLGGMGSPEVGPGRLSAWSPHSLKVATTAASIRGPEDAGKANRKQSLFQKAQRAPAFMPVTRTESGGHPSCEAGWETECPVRKMAPARRGLPHRLGPWSHCDKLGCYGREGREDQPLTLAERKSLARVYSVVN